MSFDPERPRVVPAPVRQPWEPPRLRRAGTVGDVLRSGGDDKISVVLPPEGDRRRQD